MRTITIGAYKNFENSHIIIYGGWLRQPTSWMASLIPKTTNAQSHTVL